jgi:hypothetical protein
MGYELPSTVLGKPTRCTKCGEKFELKEYVPPAPPPKPAKAAPAGLGTNAFGTTSESTNGPPRVPPPPPPAYSEFAPSVFMASPTVTSGRAKGQFLSLKIICRVLEVAAIVIATLDFALIALMWGGLATIPNVDVDDVSSVILATLFLAIAGTVLVLFLLFYSLMARLLLRIEDNTYEANESAYRLNAMLAHMNGVWQRNQQLSRKKREEVSNELEFD